MATVITGCLWALEKKKQNIIPFEWQESIDGCSRSPSRRCDFTYRQRTKARRTVWTHLKQPCPSIGECKTCSIQIMQHWHPDSPEDDFVKVIMHINTAFKLANTPIPGSQNHHVMSPCVEIEGAPTSCFLCEAQARKQCMLGKWPEC